MVADNERRICEVPRRKLASARGILQIRRCVEVPRSGGGNASADVIRRSMCKIPDALAWGGILHISQIYEYIVKLNKILIH